MALNVDIKKKEKQSSTDLLKQFTKLVKSAGIIPRLKSKRYYERNLSEFKKKEAALKKLEKAAVNERLAKLGKKIGRR